MDVRVGAPGPATDWRLAPPDWQPGGGMVWRSVPGRLLLLANVVLAARYVWWLLEPGRSSHLLLYGLLVGAEAYNLVQGLGFWWTVSRIGPVVPPRPAAHVQAATIPAASAASAASITPGTAAAPGTAAHPGTAGVPGTAARPGTAAAAGTAGVPDPVAVDVFVPTYDEPVEIVEPTVAAALQMAAPGTEVRVHVLDDGDRPAMAALARELGAGYFNRPGSHGAKSGNINWALERTDAPYVAVLDCDHVPAPDFVAACLAEFDHPDVAFVQTPQYYANWRDGGVAKASWSQQSLFFGTIARGRDALGAMFCCGTNVVFRRDALDAVGGFSVDSLTEDFELSIRLHEQGWTSRYLPRVLAAGLGPEDMGSYVSQQLRWARGCLSSLQQVLTARLPARLRLQYLLSAAYWLTGWTFVIYMAFPVVRILTGVQPIDVASPEEFLIHWGPYFVASMVTVGLAGAGRYTFAAFALMSSSFWIHIAASVLTALRRKGSFAVTPKQGTAGVQIRPVLPALLVAAGLASVAVGGLLSDRSPATFTNASFAFVHVAVIGSGVRYALERGR